MAAVLSRRGDRGLYGDDVDTVEHRRPPPCGAQPLRPDPDTFDTAAQATAGLFAAQAAIALYGAHGAEGLGHALATRDVIGQAKGILMERFSVDPDEAFQMLVHSSQDTNLKLTAVAEWVTATSVRTGERGDGPRRGVTG